MKTEIIGIVGNILYLAPFYAGDQVHSTYMTDSTKEDLIERGVIEYPSYTYLESCKKYPLTEEVIGLLSF